MQTFPPRHFDSKSTTHPIGGFVVFVDFENLTFPTFMAAITTFQLAQQVHPIISLGDIMGEWKSVIGSHASDWPCLKVVHKFDALFLGTEEVFLFKFYILYPT